MFTSQKQFLFIFLLCWINKLFEEHREGLKKPGMKASDVAKAAGVEWNKLSDKTVRQSPLIIVQIDRYIIIRVLCTS